MVVVGCRAPTVVVIDAVVVMDAASWVAVMVNWVKRSQKDEGAPLLSSLALSLSRARARRRERGS